MVKNNPQKLPNRNILDILADTVIIQVPVTLLIYLFYCLVIAISLSPSLFFLFSTYKYLYHHIAKYQLLLVICTGFCLAISCYIYFICGSIIMGLFCRVLSLGLKPRRYPQVSFVMVRWLLFSGIYGLATKTILPFITMTWFINNFFRIFGCKIGKNVRINTIYLNDAYLVEIADNVVVGAGAEISAHTFEGGKLTLGRIKIGENSIIGAHAYIMPGVTIGKKCRIGMNSIIRKNSVIANNSDIMLFPALGVKDLVKMKNNLGIKGR